MVATTENPFAIREELTTTHLFETGRVSLTDKSNLILNLTAGAPGPDRLAKCADLFDVATSHRMIQERATDSLLFQYGPAVGRHDYKTAVAKFLTGKYRDGEVNSNDLVLSTGASQGLQNILTLLIDLNGVVFVDDVTYMIGLDVFKHFSSLKVIPVPMTANGVDVQQLRRLGAEHRCECSADKVFWGMYYTTPVHHNPTGITFTSDVCQEIVSIAREFELLIVAEDVYNLLTYTANSAAPKRLFAYDRMTDAAYKGHVISNGTFSKLLSPGVRLGWMEMPPRCVRVFNVSGLLLSGGATNNYTSGVLATALELDLLVPILQDNINVYGDRMRMAISILRELLPTTCRFAEPTGGFFIWIVMPEHVNVVQLNAYSREHHNVGATSGHLFSVNREFKNCIRISIAFYPIDVLERALRNYCTAICEFLEKNPAGNTMNNTLKSV